MVSLRASPLVGVLVVTCVGLAFASALALTSGHAVSTGSDGTVEGVVSVGPSQPVCRAGESCDVNMSGYSLVFTPDCTGLCSALSRAVPLESDGHFSVTLPVRKYVVSMDSCEWIGCSAALPRTVSLSAGKTTLLNISIDTGIR